MSTLFIPAVVPDEALTLFKVFLRQDNDDEDVMLKTLLEAAIGQAEDYLQRALYLQTRRAKVSGLPADGQIQLDFGPVRGIATITYTDEAGDVVALDESLYSLDEDVLSPEGDWPSTALNILYETGMAVPSSPAIPLPPQVSSAVWLLGQILYDRNERVAPMLTSAAHRLLDTWRAGQGV